MTLEDFEKTLDKDSNTIIVFSATWCNPCKMMKPMIDLLEKERPDITIIRVDAEKEQEFCDIFSVKSVPVCVIYKGSEMVKVKSGMSKKEDLLEIIDKK